MNINLIYLEICFYTTELTVRIWLSYGCLTVSARFWSRSATHYMKVVLYNYFYVKLDTGSPVEVWINKILLFADYFVPIWYNFLNKKKCGNLFNYKYELYCFSSLQVKRTFYFEGSLLREEESQRSQFILHFRITSLLVVFIVANIHWIALPICTIPPALLAKNLRQ